MPTTLSVKNIFLIASSKFLECRCQRHRNCKCITTIWSYIKAYRTTETMNNRMAWVGRDLKDHPAPIPTLWAGFPTTKSGTALNSIQYDHEQLHEWKIHSFYGHLVFHLWMPFSSRATPDLRGPKHQASLLNPGYHRVALVPKVFVCFSVLFVTARVQNKSLSYQHHGK